LKKKISREVRSSITNHGSSVGIPSRKILNDKYVSRRVAKEFHNQRSEAGIFFGVVESALNEDRAYRRLWHIIYDDGDEEDMGFDELKQALGFYKQVKKLDHRRISNNIDHRGNTDISRSNTQASRQQLCEKTAKTSANSPKKEPRRKTKKQVHQRNAKISDLPREVDTFRNRRIHSGTGKEEYLIKWKGCPESSNSWEAFSDLNVQDDAKAWWRKETIRRNDSLLLSSDDHSDEEVKIGKDSTKWRKKISGYKLVAKKIVNIFR